MIDRFRTGWHRLSRPRSTVSSSSVPVVDDDRVLVGVVRQIDILKFLAESFPEELLNLPPRPHQRMEQAEGG